jgi:serine O-acetyltransferase
MDDIVPARAAVPLPSDRSADSQLSQPADERYWSPSVRLLESLQDYKRDKRAGTRLGLLKSKFAVVRHRFWSAVTGADIPLNTWKLGDQLQLPHPNGVVIHPEAELGFHCTLFQQVTLGTGPTPGVPILGAHVYVGAGAKILGGITIGDHAIIGANAVVIHSVPAGATAAGIPAQIKRGARGGWDRVARLRAVGGREHDADAN